MLVAVTKTAFIAVHRSTIFNEHFLLSKSMEQQSYSSFRFQTWSLSKTDTENCTAVEHLSNCQSSIFMFSVCTPTIYSVWNSMFQINGHLFPTTAIVIVIIVTMVS